MTIHKIEVSAYLMSSAPWEWEDKSKWLATARPGEWKCTCGKTFNSEEASNVHAQISTQLASKAPKTDEK